MSNAIAVWAYPDSNTVTGTIRVGVVAYHSTGIDRVVFSVDDGATTTVTAMTQNPDSLDWNGEQEYEYVYTIDTTALSDASHTVQATAYGDRPTRPNDSGLELRLAFLVVRRRHTRERYDRKRFHGLPVGHAHQGM